MPWDQIVVFLIVAAAAGYLAWRRFVAPRAGCGGCHGCGDNKAGAQPGGLVQLEAGPPRRRASS